MIQLLKEMMSFNHGDRPTAKQIVLQAINLERNVIGIAEPKLRDKAK